MANRVVWLIAALLMGFMGLSPSYVQDGNNILFNGGFEDGVLEPWSIYGGTAEVVEELVGAAVPEDPIEGNYCLHVVVPTAGANFYDSGLYNSQDATPNPYVFEQGKYYTLSAFFKCNEGTLQISFKPELGQNPWTGYGQQTITITDKWTEYYVTTPVFTTDAVPGHITFHIGYAAGDFWVDDVKFYEGNYVPTVIEKRLSATSPSPGKDAIDVPCDTTLSWAPGPFADTHNVYFGTVYDDVSNADATNTLGVLVSPKQDANSYKPDSLLEFGQTYYWRIDEVNDLHPESPWKGDVWGFTVEPFAYTIENITATASSSRVGMGPEKTIDGSGLNDSDQHSTLDVDMWLSSDAGPQPSWIQYEFDRAYKLHEMWAWNSNQSVEPLVGFGLKDVTIEYSTDDIIWTELADVPEFAQATGSDDYTHNTTVPFNGTVAKYVRLTANSNWGGPVYGLSEVRFFYKPVRARHPSPQDQATDVPLDVVLYWRTGREAATHEVYLDISEQAVIEGTVTPESVPGNGYTSSYAPLSLELGQTYYWKVTEVNSAENPVSWDSDIWSFSTIEYIVVEDFEDYNDYEPDRIFDTWIDGWGVAENGSQIGYGSAPFAERTIVNSGLQSMPFYYSNTNGVAYSEAVRTFDAPQDWTNDGVGTLTLFFRGRPVTFLESSPGNIVMSGTGADIYGTTDEFRYAYKMLSGDGSITARIESLQDTHEWAKAGVMIRLGLEPLAVQIHMVGTPRNRVEWMYRLSAGGTTPGTSTDVNSTPLPHWVRLKRQGNTFIGEHSADGVNWVNIKEGDPASSSVDIQMPSTIYIGLVVTSHVSGIPCVAEFSEVSTEGNVTGQWQLVDVGVAQAGENEADLLYVAVEDSNGTAKLVEHPDNPNAVQQYTWQQWDIPLSVLSDAGVNLSAVQKMTIGVGSQNSGQGGTGKLYFDDIRLYPEEE